MRRNRIAPIPVAPAPRKRYRPHELSVGAGALTCEVTWVPGDIPHVRSAAIARRP